MDRIALYIKILLELINITVFTCLGFLLKGLPEHLRLKYGSSFISRWCRLSCRIFNIRIKIIGSKRMVRSGTLIIANHINYWDILVLGALFPATFLSKMEIKDLPLIGAGADALGVLFVKRDSVRSGVKSIREMVKVLKYGISVISFPEGTTSTQETVIEFKAGLFLPAAMNKVPIQIIALTYKDFHLENWGDEPMGSHFRRNAVKRRHIAYVAFGERFYATSDSPLQIKDKAYASMLSTYANARAAKDQENI